MMKALQKGSLNVRTLRLPDAEHISFGAVLQSVSHFIKAYNIPPQNAFVNLRESIDGGRPEIDAKMISGLPELIQIEKKTPQIGLNDLVRWRDKRIHI